MTERTSGVASLLACVVAVALVTSAAGAATVGRGSRSVTAAGPPATTVGFDLLDGGTALVRGVTLLAAAGAAALGSRYGPRLVARLRGDDAGSGESESATSRRTAGRSTESTVDRESSERDLTPPLSDPEKVLRLLEDNDGQLPQSDIVDETPWSKSKVSRLLARMDAREQIVKVNAGRRNVIYLPGEQPAELQSPTDHGID